MKSYESPKLWAQVQDPLWGPGFTVRFVRPPDEMTMVRINDGGYLVALPTDRLKWVATGVKVMP